LTTLARRERQGTLATMPAEDTLRRRCLAMGPPGRWSRWSPRRRQPWVAVAPQIANTSRVFGFFLRVSLSPTVQAIMTLQVHACPRVASARLADESATVIGKQASLSSIPLSQQDSGWRRFHDGWWPVICGFCRTHVARSDSDVDDLAQEVLLKLFEYSKTSRGRATILDLNTKGERTIRSYLARMVDNAAKDQHRGQRMTPTYIGQFCDEDEHPGVPEPPGREPPPDASMIETETKKEIIRLFDGLLQGTIARKKDPLDLFCHPAKLCAFQLWYVFRESDPPERNRVKRIQSLLDEASAPPASQEDIEKWLSEFDRFSRRGTFSAFQEALRAQAHTRLT